MTFKTYDFIVENIKCGGCTNTITKALLEISNVHEILEIDRESQTISVKADNDLNEEFVYDVLKKLGYPKSGENNWLEKSKSVMSCAVGKLS